MSDQSASTVAIATLRVRRVAIDTYRENVAFLHRDCILYRAEGFQALSKVAVGADSNLINAVLNVVDDAAIVAPDEPLKCIQTLRARRGRDL